MKLYTHISALIGKSCVTHTQDYIKGPSEIRFENNIALTSKFNMNITYNYKIFKAEILIRSRKVKRMFTRK
jgi:hypothetical protein